MLCWKCGREVGESKPFCQSCGAKLTALSAGSRLGQSAPSEDARTVTSAPFEVKRNGSTFRRAVLWGLAIFGGLCAVGILFLLGIALPSQKSVSKTERGEEPPSTLSTQVPAPQYDKPSIPTHQMGESFSIGYWSYVCNSATWTPYLGLGFDPYTIERADAEFLVINITARNDDTSSSTLPPFHLLDKDGRIYDQSSQGMLLPGFFSPPETLNPGVSKRGNIAFDVPPDRQYVLEVSGGIESPFEGIVLLPATPTSTSPTPPTPKPSY